MILLMLLLLLSALALMLVPLYLLLLLVPILLIIACILGEVDVQVGGVHWRRRSGQWTKVTPPGARLRGFVVGSFRRAAWRRGYWG